MLLDRMLSGLIREGCLAVRYPDGETRRYGESSADPDTALTLVLKDKAVARRLALDPDPGLGEAYMEDRVALENGRVWDLLELVGHNLRRNQGKGLPVGLSRAIGFLLRTAHQINPASKSRRNVAHHYDLSGRLYDLFLDADRQYSCAYFERPDASLEEAQSRKKQHIANKLLLRGGHRVLDIGCGWGGMALTIARQAPDIEVMGVTLSQEQLDIARRRADEAGLSDRVRFELLDYRLVEGQFDRIVSVGMFEHVGVPHYREFFEKVRALLTEDGVALLHSIGRNDPPGITSPFIRKYIFPGGYIPALSEVIPKIERAGLWMTDIEILRLHYAKTLRRWRERFLENWAEAEQIYDSRFCRMWVFYLAGSEMSFRYDTMMVFQIQLSKSLETVPMTRDYLYLGNESA
jgi:cyclopropane-fatty-acyl-phospholipid synthase